MVDEKLAPWKTEVDRDVVPVAMAVMMTRQLEHDVARGNAFEQMLELLDTAPDVSGESVGLRHASERDLKGNMHWENLRPREIIERDRRAP